MRQPPAPGDVFGHVVDGAEAAADVRPEHPAWAPAMVVTDVPSLDDVLDGTVDVAGTFRDTPRKRSKSRKSRATSSRPTTPRPPLSPQPALGRPASATDTSAEAAPASETAVWPGLAAAAPDPLPAEQTDGPGRRERRSASPSLSPQRVGSAVGESGRRAAELARRRPDGVFARRGTLVATTAVALAAGLGAGAGVDALSSGEPTATVTVASVSPEACATAQVAWARAAAAQVRMDLAAPETLRTGFVGARTAMTGQSAPAPIAADWTLVQDYVTTMADAVADVEADAVEPAVVAALDTLDTDAMTASSQRITTYLGANCDL